MLTSVDLRVTNYKFHRVTQVFHGVTQRIEDQMESSNDKTVWTLTGSVSILENSSDPGFPLKCLSFLNSMALVPGIEGRHGSL